MGMTQDPTQSGLSSEKVAELEHKLADAAAEVAKVQAQLSRAQHAGDPPPPAGVPLSTSPPPGAGAPGTTIPSVPYAGATSPHVVMINGQQVVPGSGNMLQVLQQLGRAGGPPPVVMVNGQQVSLGGQMVDIGKYLTPEVTQRIASSLSALGLDHGLGAMFGSPPGPPAPPEVLAPLADPPRHVPFELKLSTFAWSWWELFGLAIGTAAPIALWMFVPQSFSIALVAAVLVIGWFRVRRYRRLGLLKHGKVATVTNTEVLDTGTYYSGVTYQNMRVPQAHGWHVTRSFYSGPSTTTKIDYSVDGASGSLKLRGLPYEQGVVLADPSKANRAAVVSAFPFSMQPGPDGQLVGSLSVWSWLGVICTLVVEASLVFLAAYVVWQTWFR
jgi:hypothetical protein